MSKHGFKASDYMYSIQYTSANKSLNMKITSYARDAILLVHFRDTESVAND